MLVLHVYLNFVDYGISIFMFNMISFSLYMLLICLAHMFIRIIYWWLFNWFLDVFRCISFWCCQMGISCNESKIVLCVLCAMFQGEHKRFPCYTQSRLNSKRKLVRHKKKGEWSCISLIHSEGAPQYDYLVCLSYHFHLCLLLIIESPSWLHLSGLSFEIIHF